MKIPKYVIELMNKATELRRKHTDVLLELDMWFIDRKIDIYEIRQRDEANYVDAVDYGYGKVQIEEMERCCDEYKLENK